MHQDNRSVYSKAASAHDSDEDKDNNHKPITDAKYSIIETCRYTAPITNMTTDVTNDFTILDHKCNSVEFAAGDERDLYRFVWVLKT